MGAYIIKHLVNAGYSVRAIRRSNKLPFFIPKQIFEPVEWVNGDVLDVISLDEAMEGVDTVIHAAAVVSFLRKERKNMYKVNVEGTANVVNAAIDKGVQRFVHISSVAALGRKGDGSTVDENKKWEASAVNSHYSISKFKAELEVWRGISEGLNAVILNPSTVLGFGDWNNGSSAIFRNVYNEFKWYPPGINGFVGVDDLAAATVLAMGSDITGERFIISGENWPFRQLMDTMATCYDKQKPVRPATPFLLGIAWRMEKIRSMITGVKPLVTKESVKVANSRTYFDNTKFLKAFPGFAYTPLKETIEEACEKYMEVHGKKQ